MEAFLLANENAKYPTVMGKPLNPNLRETVSLEGSLAHQLGVESQKDEANIIWVVSFLSPLLSTLPFLTWSTPPLSPFW